MANDENYATAPQTITELRADRENNAALCTTRDVLVGMLRDIDSGEMPEPDAIFIAYGSRLAPGVTSTYFRQRAGSYWETLGLIEAAKLKLSTTGKIMVET